MDTAENVNTINATNEPLKSVVCWKSVIAGLFISAIAYLALTALGAGIGGITASNFVANQEGSVSGLATGAGVWLGLSAVIALFIGSYFTVRATKFTNTKAGVLNALTVGALFFFFAIWGLGSGVGSVAKGLATTALTATNSAATLASNPMMQDTVNKAIGDSDLKSDPQTVAQGVTVRLLQGDTDSAKAYFAYQTGQSTAEVDQKINDMKAEFDQKAKIVAQKTADSVATAGWSLFVTMILGLGAAAIAGGVAARSNLHVPIQQFSASYETVRTTIFGFSRPVLNQNGDVLPYAIAWLLGVPMSILLLIAMLRAVF